MYYKTPEISTWKLMQQSSHTDPRDDMSCLKWTIKSGTREVSVSFKTDRDKLNIEYRYRNNSKLKNNGSEFKLIEYQKFRAKRVYALVTSTSFLCDGLCTMKQLFIIETIFIENGCSLSSEDFPILFANNLLERKVSRLQSLFSKCTLL